MRNTKPVIEKKREFLRLFQEELTITQTSKRMKIAKGIYYYWRKTDPIFDEAMNLVCEEVADSLEAEALRRAYVGIEEDIYYLDKVIGKKQEYSDALLILLLKGLRPEKYRDKKKGNRKGNADIIVNVIPPGESPAKEDIS